MKLLAVLAALVAGHGLAAAASPDAPAEPRGTFRLQGTARLSAGGALTRRLELHADAVLAPGSGPGEVRVRVAAEGAACELLARLDEAGALAFDPGQRCPVSLDGPGARGHVDATLRTGRGRLAGEHLTLELEGEVKGALRLRAGGGEVLGAELPVTWLPETPIDGEARASAEGHRDRSRAASP